MAASGKKAFNAGTLLIGTEEVGVLQDVQLSISYESVPLNSAKRFAEDIALGKATISGSAKSGEFNPTLVATIANSNMGPQASEVSLTWTITEKGGATRVFTLNNVIITSYKMGAGAGAWFMTDITFEAAAPATGNVLTVAAGT